MPMNGFMRLLRDNAKASAKAAPDSIRVEENDNEATLYIYDVIVSVEDDWFGGVGADAFVKELRALDVETIHIRINSPGGSVFAARAIEQAIREHSAKIIAHVDGYAASAASFIAVACDEVEMAAGGFFMIHKAWMCSCGNSDDMAAAAALLDKLDASLVATYAAETGQNAEDIAEWMRAETWFDAQEAVEKGFADRVAGNANAKALKAWNLSAFKNAPAPEKPEAPENSVQDAKEEETEETPAIAASAEREYYLRRLEVTERLGR